MTERALTGTKNDKSLDTSYCTAFKSETHYHIDIIENMYTEYQKNRALTLDNSL